MMEKKKQEIYEAMKPFIGDNSCIDITGFREQHPKLYTLIPNYFGSISAALEELNLVKVTIARHKTGVKAVSLKDMLAFDMLEEMRKKSSLEDIAQRYGVTRAAINQLHKALKTTIEKSQVNMED